MGQPNKKKSNTAKLTTEIINPSNAKIQPTLLLLITILLSCHHNSCFVNLVLPSVICWSDRFQSDDTSKGRKQKYYHSQTGLTDYSVFSCPNEFFHFIDTKNKIVQYISTVNIRDNQMILDKIEVYNVSLTEDNTVELANDV